MNIPQITNRKWNYPALAFIMTCGGLLLLRLFGTLTFNGAYSLLYSDNYHQYYPFFVAFRKALLSGESLLSETYSFAAASSRRRIYSILF